MSALIICIVLRTIVVFSMCLVYVSLGSRVSPSIFGLMFMGSVVSICSASCVLYDAGSGVKRVRVVLSGLRIFFSMYVFPVGMIEYLLLRWLCRFVL